MTATSATHQAGRLTLVARPLEGDVHKRAPATKGARSEFMGTLVKAGPDRQGRGGPETPNGEALTV